MEEKKGIKEITEAFVALGALVQIGKKVSQDGLKADDLMTLFTELVAKFPVLTMGFNGLSEALEEAKDLDHAEMVTLFTVVLAEIGKVESI